MSREYLYELLDPHAFVIPGADQAICGVTPNGLPVYHYNLLVEFFMDKFREDDPSCNVFVSEEDLHVGAIEWVEYNICQNPQAPLIMYEIIDD